jgi:putative transposase
MSSKYKVRDDTIPYFVTTTVVGWVSALSRSEYKDILLESFRYCVINKGLEINAWVIMDNHLHLIVRTRGKRKLYEIIRDFKKFTCNAVIDAILANPKESRKEWMVNMFRYIGESNPDNNIYQFWQGDYHPVALDTEEKLMQRLNYLHENPVRAGIVWEASQYKYSSAIDYVEGKKGLLDVVMLF